MKFSRLVKKQFSFLKIYHLAVGGAYETFAVSVNYFPEVVGFSAEDKILGKFEVVYGDDFRYIYQIFGLVLEISLHDNIIL